MFQKTEKEEEKQAIAKDSEVEVRSEEEGFVGVWYRAILEDSPTRSRRIGLKVRYTTLLQEDCSTPLTETVQQRFIRPVPPEDLYEGFVFGEGSVVDADLKDGWWEGVIVKKLEDDDELFLVCFDTPPDILQFNKMQLRPHLDWTGSEWVKPQNKELRSKSLFSSGTTVEVSREISSNVESVWVPAIVVKEINKKEIIVKSCYKPLTFNADEVIPTFRVDVCKVRPVPPPSSVEDILLAPVEAFVDSAWRQCLVRALLTDKHYQVSFVATKEECVFKHSELRLSMVWKDGVWYQLLNEKNYVKETPSEGQKKRLLSDINALSSRPKKLKVIRSSSAAAAGGGSSNGKPIRKSQETTDLHETVVVKESGNQMAGGGVMVGAAATPVITTQVIPIEKEAVIKATNPKESLEPMSVQNGEKTCEEHHNKGDNQQGSNLKETTGMPINGSAEALIADTSEDNDYDQPLSAWIHAGNSSNDSDKSKKLPSHGTTAPKNAAPDETRASEVVLPFVKLSPIWKTLESMEIFKTAKKSPHFRPLLDKREEVREGLAVGEMVNFSNLLERVRGLQLHTPKSTLEGLKECFYELDKYGFEVTEPISRIDMLVSLIDEKVSKEVKLKEIDKEKREAVRKVQEVREELREVEDKILELQNQKTDLEGKKNESEKKIAHMELCAEDLDRETQEAELEFQKILQYKESEGSANREGSYAAMPDTPKDRVFASEPFSFGVGISGERPIKKEQKRKGPGRQADTPSPAHKRPRKLKASDL